MTAQNFQPVSGRRTTTTTRRQSHCGSLQYSSIKPYSPLGRSSLSGTVTERVSRAPSSGNLFINGVMAMVELYRQWQRRHGGNRRARGQESRKVGILKERA